MSESPLRPRSDPARPSPATTQATRWPGMLRHGDVHDREPRIMGFARTVRHSWRTVAAFIAMTCAAAAAYLALATPLYTAQAKIAIQKHSPRFVDMEALLGDTDISSESDYYRMQRVILMSRNLAERTVKTLDLTKDPRFSRSQPSGGLLASAASALQNRLAGGLPDVAAGGGELDPAILGVYQDSLRIDAPFRTRLVAISFTSPDPGFAKSAVDAHIQAYIDHGVDQRDAASQEASRFLERKLVELKQRLEASEIALNAYRRDTGMVSLDDKENLVVERLSRLNDLLAVAEADRIKHEAEIIGIDQGNRSAIPEVAKSRLIQILERQTGELESDYLGLSSQFKSNYPAVQQARVRLEEMQRRLDEEVGRTVARLQSAYLTAVEKENRLRESLEEQKQKAFKQKDAAVQYAILKREADSHRGLYESVLDRRKELDVATAAHTSNISILEPPVVPLSRSSPRSFAILMFALFGGLGSGIACVLGRDAIDSSIDTPEEAEQVLRIPSLGVIPDVSALPEAKGSRDSNSVDVVADDVRRPALAAGEPSRVSAEAANVMAESYRNCRTGILFSRPDAPPKTMLFSSALPFEGKTTTVLNVALSFHQMNPRVLVIDADLRMPKCHTGLRLENREGLSDVLTGQRSLADVVQPSRREGLHLLAAGKRPPNPTELLGSQALVRLLEEAAQAYDHILIDTPPIMAVSDAVVLAPRVDGVILVLRAHSTPRQIVERADARLRQAQANVLGILLNQFDASRDSFATSYGGKYYSPYYGADDVSGH